jgi:chromosome segregation ATPase
MRLHTRPRLLVLALAAGLVACGGIDTSAEQDREELQALREQVETLVERDAQRDTRIEDLELAAERLSRADPSTRITDTERELARVVETLSMLDEELAAAVTEGAQRDTEVAATTGELAEQNAALREANDELRATVGELREQLDNARSRVDRVSGEVEDLEIRYETLRDRVDRAGR